MAARGMWNKISSVMVPPGYKLELYKDESWESKPHTVIGRLRDDSEGIFCYNLTGTDFDNRT